jgi:hypothetical protein
MNDDRVTDLIDAHIAARLHMEQVWVDCGYKYESAEYQAAQAAYDAAVQEYNDYFLRPLTAREKGEGKP